MCKIIHSPQNIKELKSDLQYRENLKEVNEYANED